MADKAKAVALDEGRRLQTLTTQAARSGAYFYPIRVSLWRHDGETSGRADGETRVSSTSRCTALYGITSLILLAGRPKPVPTLYDRVMETTALPMLSRIFQTDN